MSAIALTIQMLRLHNPLSAAFGNRIYPIAAPAGAAPGYIIVSLVNDDEEELLAGSSQWPEGRVSIAIISMEADTTLDGGETIIDWLRDKDRYPLTLGGQGYEVTFRKEGTDVTDDAEGPVYRRILDYYVRRRKT